MQGEYIQWTWFKLTGLFQLVLFVFTTRKSHYLNSYFHNFMLSVWLPKQFLSGECSNKTNGKFQTELNGITLNSNICNQLFRLETISNTFGIHLEWGNPLGFLTFLIYQGVLKVTLPVPNKLVLLKHLQECKTALTSKYQVLFLIFVFLSFWPFSFLCLFVHTSLSSNVWRFSSGKSHSLCPNSKVTVRESLTTKGR